MVVLKELAHLRHPASSKGEICVERRGQGLWCSLSLVFGSVQYRGEAAVGPRFAKWGAVVARS